MKFKELEFILKLTPEQFLKSAQQASTEQTKLAKKVEKPLKVNVQVKSAVDNLARLGLAWNGITAIYRSVVGVAKSVIDASNVQEKADQRLAIALKAAGDATRKTYNEQRKFASWIQTVTTVGDEQAEMLMSMALNMQAPIESIQDVTRNAIALSKAFKLDMNVAIRASVAALDEDYSMLTRYIPALRSAGTTAEKTAVYQRTVNDGWTTATEELNSAAGALDDFSNTLSDFKEVAGDLLKSILLPLLNVLNPLIKAINDLEPATRNAGLALAAMLIILKRFPGALKLIDAELKVLKISVGPAGWLILGLGTLATIWLKTKDATQLAAEALERYRGEVEQIGNLGLEQQLKQIQLRMEELTQKITSGEVSFWDHLKTGTLNAFNAVMGNYQGIKTIHADEFEELKQLELRQKAINQVLKERSTIPVGTTPGTAAATPATPTAKPGGPLIPDNVAADQVAAYDGLFEISTEFQDLTYNQLNDEYAFRALLIENNLQNLRAAYGEGSAAYQAELTKRQTMDRRYNQAKKQLEEQAARDTLAIGAQLMNAFQGQNETMFRVGQAAAIADATVNAYKGMSESLANYPLPYAAIIAAIHLALGLANVSQIASVKYKPSGKATGGKITEADVLRSAMTPDGENGIIGVQTGEYIVNRYATKRYEPLLEMMNSGRMGSIPARASGGPTGTPTAANVSLMSRGDLDYLAEKITTGYRDNRPVINAQLDSMKFYFDTFSKFEKERARRRF